MSDDFTVRLCKLVQGHPELYDIFNDNFHNEDAKNSAWNLISTELGVPRECAQQSRSCSPSVRCRSVQTQPVLFFRIKMRDKVEVIKTPVRQGEEGPEHDVGSVAGAPISRRSGRQRVSLYIHTYLRHTGRGLFYMALLSSQWTQEAEKHGSNDWSGQC